MSRYPPRRCSVAGAEWKHADAEFDEVNPGAIADMKQARAMTPFRLNRVIWFVRPTALVLATLG